MKILRTFPLSLWLISTTLSFLFLLFLQVLCQDLLFFKSTTLDIWLFYSVLACSFGTVLTLVASPLYVANSRVFHLLRSIFLYLICLFAIWTSLTALGDSYAKDHTWLSSVWCQPVWGMIAAIASWFAIQDSERHAKINYLSYLIAACLGVGVVVHLVKCISIKEAKTKNNLVLIVVDSWSWEDFPHFDQSISQPEFETLKQNVRIFDEVRTNGAYTSKFFKALYFLPRSNLFHTLQDQGINTRWIANHNNALPDINPITYQGLRSTFLNFNGARLLNYLGFDYNIFALTEGRWARGKAMGVREAAIMGILDKWLVKEKARPWHERMLEQISFLRNDPRAFFLLSHVFPYFDRPAVTLEKLWIDKKDTGSNADEGAEAITYWKSKDYRYQKNEEAMVRKLHQERIANVRIGLEELNIFIEEIKKRGWDKDTQFIVTADHGATHRNGRLWYGFHPVEGVDRTPFFAFGQALPTGVDHRLFGTAELRQSVIDYFADTHWDPKAAEKVVTRHTLSFQTQEDPVSVYSPGIKIVINYFDQKSKPTGKKYKVVGLEETEVPLTEAELSEAIKYAKKR